MDRHTNPLLRAVQAFNSRNSGQLGQSGQGEAQDRLLAQGQGPSIGAQMAQLRRSLAAKSAPHPVPTTLAPLVDAGATLLG